VSAALRAVLSRSQEIGAIGPAPLDSHIAHSLGFADIIVATDPSVTSIIDLGSAALRISAGRDRREQLPTFGPPCVEERPDAVVAERREPERGTLDALDQVVRRLGRSVGDVTAVPRGDLCSPTSERPPERADLGSDGSKSHMSSANRSTYASASGALWCA
jgi:hypothetical protein